MFKFTKLICYRFRIIYFPGHPIVKVRGNLFKKEIGRQQVTWLPDPIIRESLIVHYESRNAVGDSAASGCQ